MLEPGRSILGAILIATSGVASAEDTFHLPLLIESGDRLVIQYAHERNENGDSKTGNIAAEIVIDDVLDGHFVATWTTYSVEVDGYNLDTRSAAARDFLLGVPIKFEAGLDGAPIRIVDRNRLLDSMFQGATFAGEPEEAIAQVRGIFDSMSEAAFAQLMLKVPAYMSICQETSLPLGERIEDTVLVPNPMGGEPVDADISYVLQTFDTASGNAHIEYESALDPESSKQMVSAFLNQLGIDGNPDESDFDDISIERNDSASCKIDIEDGWVESLTFRTEIQVAGRFQAETYVVSVGHKPPVAE